MQVLTLVGGGSVLARLVLAVSRLSSTSKQSTYLERIQGCLPPLSMLVQHLHVFGEGCSRKIVIKRASVHAAPRCVTLAI
jgi:hypothetical protein